MSERAQVETGSPIRTLRFGVFEADPRSWELRRSGLVIRLQPQARRVLATLLEQPGRTVSREELRRVLWGDGTTFVSFDRSLNFCLSKLRAALGDDARSPRFIETIAGQGYRFIAPVTTESLPPATPEAARRAPSDGVLPPGGRWAAVLAAMLVLTVPLVPGGARLHDSGAEALYAEARALCGESGWRKSVGLYQEVCRRDPRHASAHAGMAESYLALGAGGHLAPSQALPAAAKAARQALAIEDRADARLVLGRVLLAYDWDWQGAERELRRALALEPSSAPAWVHWARYLSARTDHAAALGAAKHAEMLDPASPQAIEEAAWCYYRARRFDEAARQFRLVAEGRPEEGHHRMFAIFRLAGRDAEALREATTVMRKAGVADAQLRAVERLAPRQGADAYLRGTLAFLRREASRQRVPAERFALLYAGLGENRAAIGSLQEAAAERSLSLLTTLVDPALDGLRAEPAFVQLARRVGSRAAAGSS